MSKYFLLREGGGSKGIFWVGNDLHDGVSIAESAAKDQEGGCYDWNLYRFVLTSKSCGGSWKDEHVLVFSVKGSQVGAFSESEKDGSDLLLEIGEEIEQAVKKFPSWPDDPFHALAILGEEFGELTKAVLQLVYEPEKYYINNESVRAEVVQVAAMAIRFAASLGKYRYVKSGQHKQEGGT